MVLGKPTGRPAAVLGRGKIFMMMESLQKFCERCRTAVRQTGNELRAVIRLSCQSVARRRLDRRDWQLAVCVVVVLDSGDLFFLLLLVVIVDNDSFFRIAVHYI